MTADETPSAAREAELRDRAIKHLKKRRDFQGHLLMYVLVNGFLVVIWAMSDPNGFFWPIFLILGWGIGVVANAWDVYRDDEIDEEQIQREMEHLQSRRRRRS